jgi:hypothetical protein
MSYKSVTVRIQKKHWRLSKYSSETALWEVGVQGFLNEEFS